MFVLELSIVPRSSRDKFVLESSGIKLKITAPPVDGQANQKIIEILSKSFSVPKSSIKLISGIKSKKKKFLFTTLNEQEGKVLLASLLDS